MSQTISGAATITGANVASGDLFPLLDVSAAAGSQASKITRDELIKLMPSEFVILLSGPLVTTAATTGRKAWWRVVRAFTLIAGDVSFDCVTAPTGTAAVADIEKNGSSIYSANPTIGTSQISSTSGTGSSVGTISGTTASFAVGDIVGVWIDQIGTSLAGCSLTMLAKHA